jgi:NitT/TauT family transport system substrate-binding protein
MHIAKRHVVVAAVLAGAMAGCGGSPSNSGGGGSSSQPIDLKIMVRGLNKQIYLPNMLAQRLGYFAQQGLNVTLIDEASGQSAEQELIAGNVDAASGSYNHTQELQPKGKLIESVVQLQLAPGEAEMVRANEASTITSAGDLKGKNLGVTELGSGTHTLTMALLGRQGVSPDQAHFIPVGAGDTFIAGMQQGKIDAGMTTEPTISRLISTGVGKVLVDLRTPQTTEAALGGDYPFICVFMKNDYVNSHKDVVQKLVNAYVKTLKYIASHTAAQITDQMPADYYSADKAAYITALDNQKASFTPDGVMPSSGPQLVSHIETKYVPSMQGATVDLSQTYTNQFATAATG